MSDARAIEAALIVHYRASSSLVCPRFEPVNWWECDLFRVSKAGYWSEFEIKTSVADFRADRKKSRERRSWAAADASVWTEVKHLMLASGAPAGPSQFTFVLTEEVLAAVRLEVPEWAGITEARLYRKRWRFNPVREAPKLHRVKLDEKVADRCRINMSYRYLNHLVEAARTG